MLGCQIEISFIFRRSKADQVHAMVVAESASSEPVNLYLLNKRKWERAQIKMNGWMTNLSGAPASTSMINDAALNKFIGRVVQILGAFFLLQNKNIW